MPTDGLLDQVLVSHKSSHRISLSPNRTCILLVLLQISNHLKPINVDIVFPNDMATRLTTEKGTKHDKHILQFQDKL